MDIKPVKELIKLSKELQENFNFRWKSLNLQTDYDRVISYKEQAKEPKFWDNPDKAQEISKLQNVLEKKLNPWLSIRQEILDFPDLIEMTLEESSDEATLLSLNEDYARLLEEFTKLELLGSLSGEDDGNNQ